MSPIKGINYPIVPKTKYEITKKANGVEDKTAKIAQDKFQEQAQKPHLPKGGEGLKQFLNRKIKEDKL